MSIEIRKAGLLTTVQDLGRYGYRSLGVSVSGTMDQFALRAANILVGNETGAAGLEITLQGPEIVFHQNALLAICGGDFHPLIDEQRVPMWRPIVVQTGQVLRLPYAREGCRAYLAIAGGVLVPSIMESFSTYMRAGIGGMEGRALLAGDILELGDAGWGVKVMREYATYSQIGVGHNTAFVGSSDENEGSDTNRYKDVVAAPWYLSESIRPTYDEHPVVRVIRGKESEHFTKKSLGSLLSNKYRVSPQSDRMGYRLQGERLELKQPLEMITEAVAAGTLQVPPDGQPILLMADCQTTGGYPRVAHVISVDLPLVAQVKPGGTLRFREVSMAEAQEQYLLREMDLRLLQAGVKGRLTGLGIWRL
jgi:antagonist of KipI